MREGKQEGVERRKRRKGGKDRRRKIRRKRIKQEEKERRSKKNPTSLCFNDCLPGGPAVEPNVQNIFAFDEIFAAFPRQTAGVKNVAWKKSRHRKPPPARRPA